MIVHQSTDLPFSAEDAYNFVLPLPLPQLFAKRHGPFPPITSTDQEGEWGTVGQTRVIHTSDGASMHETLTAAEAPGFFGYKIGNLAGPMKALIRRVEGRWSLEPAGTGSRVTWTWDVTPTTVGKLAMPVFGVLWKGYAAKALARIEPLYRQAGN